MAIVSLCPGHGYKGFDAIRQDVESIVMQKKPDGVQGEVRYLTDASTGKTLPGRKTLFRDTKILVEDVLDTSGEVTRRLVAVNAYNRIQAQVIVEAREGGALPQADEAWGLVPAKPNTKPTANSRLIDFAYNRAAFLAVAAFGVQDKSRGSILGLGSGILGSFIQQYLKVPEITEVEAHSQVVDIAKKYFSYQRNAIVADAAHHIKDCASDSQDFIVVDLDDFSLDQAVPPSTIFSSEFVQAAKRSLKTHGVFVTIVDNRNGAAHLHSQIVAKEFTHVYEIPALKEEFSIIVAEKNPDSDWETRRKQRVEYLKKTVFNFNTCDDWAENEFTEMLDRLSKFQH